jgi:hypothetical protein
MAQLGESITKGCDRAMMSMPQYKILYKNYENRVEFSSCSDCDTIIMKLKGVEFKQKNEYSGSLTVEDDMKRATIRLLCVKGQDTTNYGAFGFRCLELPNPKVYLGTSWINDPLIDEKTDEETIFKPGFKATFERQAMISGIRLEIVEWSIGVNKRTYFGDSKNITKELRDVIYESEKNEAIVFNYVDVKYSTGETRRIHINRVYHKKTEYGTKPEVTKQSKLTPADG